MSESYEGLARAMGVDNDTATEMRAAYAALNIDWHCAGRHGVIRDVSTTESGYVQRVIEWHMGHGACRWTKAVGGKRSVEFVHMTKVFPPPRKPWQWCGVTVLFTDWQAQEQAQEDAGQKFTPGERVRFVHKHDIKEGVISRINRKTVSVTVEGEGGWTVPPTELYKIPKEV